MAKHGGKRAGAGRKKQPDSMVIRVPVSQKEVLKAVSNVISEYPNSQQYIFDLIPHRFNMNDYLSRNREKNKQKDEQIKSLNKRVNILLDEISDLKKTIVDTTIV